MLSSADRYRQHAKECLTIAQTARDEEDRAVWIILAQAWARLAQHDEQREIGIGDAEMIRLRQAGGGDGSPEQQH
jgi:hypothetical protein